MTLRSAIFVTLGINIGTCVTIPLISIPAFVNLSLPNITIKAPTHASAVKNGVMGKLCNAVICAVMVVPMLAPIIILESNRITRFRNQSRVAYAHRLGIYRDFSIVVGNDFDIDYALLRFIRRRRSTNDAPEE